MRRLNRQVVRIVVVAIVCSVTAAACTRRQPPVARPAPPPDAVAPPPVAAAPPPAPPERVEDRLPVPSIAEDAIANRSLEDLNRNSPFRPAFFGLDSAELDDTARAVIQSNAEILRRNAAWAVTIEGHCDERGTAEYNLALGERRAVVVRTYLVSLGIPADRLRIVSYGKEFPFNPGHDDTAHAQNRRAHFVITTN